MDGIYDPETGEVEQDQDRRRALPALPESRPQNLIFASPACGEIFGALAEMQGQMEPPKRTKKARVQTKVGPGYEYNYAPLEEIISAIKAPMAKSALAYRQFLASRDGQWVMRTVIAHRSGEWMGCDYPIFWDQSRGMQGFASGVTYARRYGLMLALGIAAEDDDDANVADGNIATTGPTRAAPPPAAHRPKAATPQPDDADLTKRYREIQDLIDAATDVPDAESIELMPAWEELRRRLIEAKGDQSAHVAMNTLRKRIERRVAMLMGGQE